MTDIVRTVEDYDGLPEGSIVAQPGGNPSIKGDRWWYGVNGPRSGDDMAFDARIILRYGWGE